MKNYSKAFLVCFLMICTYQAKSQQINRALNQNISGFPVIDRNPFENLIDGNDATVWTISEASPANFIKIDFKNEQQIDRVLFKNIKGVENIQVSIISSGESTEVFNGSYPQNHLISFTPRKGTSIRFDFQGKEIAFIGDIEVYSYESQPVMVNQVGFNLLDVKRFTAPLASDNTPFIVKNNKDQEVYSGIIEKNIGDFSDFNPNHSGPYYIEVNGKETGRSFPFKIEPYLIERTSYYPAMAFMADVRCWYGCAVDYNPTAAGTGCSFLGVAWRDSHQFSFEIPTLLSLYYSNPQAFDLERMPQQGVYEGLREKLPANTPEIVRMIYWAVDIYLRGEVNHTLLKSQLAWFLHAWPHLSEYIPQNVYEEARDYLFSIWGNPEKDRWNWYDIDHTADLFQTYTVIGSGKGQFPPGFSIIPNLLMYEVALREKRSDAEKYFNAAFAQTKWLIDNLDWNAPGTTKGQRMNEYVTLDALAYFQNQYPKRAPKKLKKKIQDWAEVAIKRADNMWDYRMYDANQWTIPDILYPEDPKFNPKGSFNEPGNIAGFPAPALAAISVLEREKGNESINQRLAALATTHIDHVFGRNPAGRHFSYDAVVDFDGADLGWFREHQGGAGMLQTARGVLDGSPKEVIFPYNPNGGDPGWTEGWVTFNTAWMMGMAYKTAYQTRIELLERNSTQPISSSAKTGKLDVRLYAPLNLNSLKQETAILLVTNRRGENWEMVLTENDSNGLYFEGVLDLSQAPFRLQSGEEITISYGLEHFKKSMNISIK